MKRLLESLAQMDPADRLLTFAICGVSACFFLYLSIPILFGLSFQAGDLLMQSLPFRKFYADSLANHQSFLWTPSLYGGFYLHGEGQAGMMHPAHLLLYSVLPLTASFGIEILATYVFLFAGCYLCFRSWKLGAPAALFGSFLFTFGGTNLILLEHMNAIAVVAHLPWLLLAIQRVFESHHPRTRALWLAAAAALTGSQVLLGHPQSVYFCALIEGGFALHLMSVEVSLMSVKVRWVRLIQVIAALFTGLLIGGVQLIPAIAAVRDSVRATPPIEFLSEMSLHPLELLQWINPLLWKGYRYNQDRTFYNLFIYCGGVVTLLLFLWILTRKDLDSNRRKLTRFLGILAFAGMFLALGKYNLLFPLYARLPVIGLFRAPARYTVLTDFAIAAGAAMALDHLRKTAKRITLSPFMKAAAAAFVAASAASFLAALSLRSPHLASPLLALAGAAIVIAGAALFLIAPRLPYPALAIFVLLEAACVQGGVLVVHAKIGDPYAVDAPPVDAPGPVASASGDRLLLLDYRLVDGYSGLEPASPIPINSSIYARIMGAKAIWQHAWKVLPNPLPLVRLRNRAVLMQNRGALLRDSSLLAQAALMDNPFIPPTLDSELEQAAHFDFVNAALVESPLSLDPNASGTLKLTEDRPGRMTLDADVTGSMLATAGVRFHSGWKVFVDGARQNAVRVDGSLLGIVVPAGHHRIECRFEPDDFGQGILASLIGLAGMLLYVGAVFALSKHPRDPVV